MTRRKTGIYGIEQDRARHERRVQRMCDERGLHMTASGTVWHITGPGIDVRAADLAQVTPEDLDPKTRAARWD